MRKLLAALVPIPFLLGACGSGNGHNADDVTFARQMVPHHEQAVEMSRLVAGSDAGPAVTKLATQIEKAQGPEISTMNGWLNEWGAASTQTEHAAGGGMMSHEQMTELEQVSGAEFDRLWLTLMVEHHEGAVTMAEGEMRDGKNSEAIDLARKIASGQTAEIDHMKEMLDD